MVREHKIRLSHHKHMSFMSLWWTTSLVVCHSKVRRSINTQASPRLGRALEDMEKNILLLLLLLLTLFLKYYYNNKPYRNSSILTVTLDFN